ncbi:MAG: hypothetical protein PW789_01105 [Edaphobacter sp.]|nr:hypothetical protein [Edaphobacter sp.]MDE1175188.1 hypothetical protein [Edaphobacter sp.]
MEMGKCSFLHPVREDARFSQIEEAEYRAFEIEPAQSKGGGQARGKSERVTAGQTQDGSEGATRTGTLYVKGLLRLGSFGFGHPGRIVGIINRCHVDLNAAGTQRRDLTKNKRVRYCRVFADQVSNPKRWLAGHLTLILEAESIRGMCRFQQENRLGGVGKDGFIRIVEDLEDTVHSDQFEEGSGWFAQTGELDLSTIRVCLS